MPDLTDFQLEVTRLFFSLPASKGFLLAGGAALLAQHLTTRPTEDLDFFTAPDRGHVPADRDALEAAARKGAGPPSVSTTATHSAGSSSGATQAKWRPRTVRRPLLCQRSLSTAIVFASCSWTVTYRPLVFVV